MIYNHEIDRWLAIKFWFVGLILGLLPYILGYLSLILAFQGFEPFYNWLRPALSSMEVLSSSQTLWFKLENALNYTFQALSNNGNEAMIFNDSGETGILEQAKFIFMYSTMFVAIFMAVKPKDKLKPRDNQFATQMVALPLSYFFIAALLGNRLWVHHYAVFVPLFYLISAIVLHKFSVIGKSKLAGLIPFQSNIPIVVFGITLLVINLYQQQIFFSKVGTNWRCR